MALFGLIGRKAETKALGPVHENRGGWFRIFESYSGAWQNNVTVDHNTVLAFHAVYSCMTLIASDIAKLRVKLVERGSNRIWTETESAAYSPVLRKPNTYQNRIQFWEHWVLSKLSRGNTYALKRRDQRNVVTALYILDPQRVTPMVNDSGDVFYQLSADNMSGLERDILVPAREIIHDRMNCLFHPLVGTSPIFAAGIAATQGHQIQENAVRFFGNQSRPGGILVAPGHIADETATRLKEYWNTNFTGENAGKVAVIGDGLKFESLAIHARDSQMIEHSKWSAEIVCSTFHVPPYKIGLGALPSYNNIQALNVEYYSQCLQSYIEAAELCLDEGLEMKPNIGTEFDLDGLLRMDSVTQMQVAKEGIAGGVLAPNEARAKLDLQPAEGGNSPYMQQQNFSLAALAKRDAQDNPFGSPTPPPAPEPEEDDGDEEGEDDDADNAEFEAARAISAIAKGFLDVRR